VGQLATRREIESFLREIGQVQHGVATRAQLLRYGLASHTIDRMVRACRVVVLRRGLYQIGPQPAERAAETAAVLACGPYGTVSHTSAAAFHGLLDATRARPTVEVTVPRDKRRRIEGVRIHRMRDVFTDEVMVLDGIPVTTPARTLLDIAESMTSREVEQALASAYRKGLVRREEMRTLVDRHPRHRGAPMLRRLLDAEGDPAFTRSRAEEKLLEIVRGGRLPRPELNVQLLGHEVDFLWREARVVAEVVGYAFHSSMGSFAADRRRDAELAAAGYRILRFTWADVTEGRLATVVRLAQASAALNGKQSS
jgi:very-short-patch-repair endonuclease